MADVEKIAIDGGDPSPQPLHTANEPLNIPKNMSVLDALMATDPSQLSIWEECELPSKGFYYGWQTGAVKVRPMDLRAERIMTTQRLGQTGQSIDMLFNEYVQYPVPGFDSADLLIGDRTFLLFFIRGITYGNKYEFAVKCPHCETQALYDYDLNTLASTINWANPSLGNEPFDVRLPYYSERFGKDVIASLKFIRASDSTRIVAKRKARQTAMGIKGSVRPNARRAVDPRQQQQQNQSIDETLSENLESVIVSIDGDNAPFKLQNAIQQMHSADVATIREWLRENTPGIDNTVIVTCKNCSAEFTIELPITESFFRQAKS